MVLGTRAKEYKVSMIVKVDDCVGASDDLLRSYLEYKLGLSVSKYQPLIIEDLTLSRIFTEKE